MNMMEVLYILEALSLTSKTSNHLIETLTKQTWTISMKALC